MNTQLTTVPIDDGWRDTAAENSERIIKGSILKYNDRHYAKGKESEDVEEGTKLVVLGAAAGWVRWQDGKPIEYRMREPGRRLPEREELGDLDENQWERGPNSERKDPWQNTRYVYLEDPRTAEAFTFSTSSWGGRQAVTDLAEQIERMRLKHPGAVPLIELRSAPHKTKYGMKSKPFFKVLGWELGEYENRRDVPNGNATPALAVKNKKTTNDMDDEIPF
jgi:hypothetical protein